MLLVSCPAAAPHTRSAFLLIITISAYVQSQSTSDGAGTGGSEREGRAKSEKRRGEKRREKRDEEEQQQLHTHAACVAGKSCRSPLLLRSRMSCAAIRCGGQSGFRNRSHRSRVRYVSVFVKSSSTSVRCIRLHFLLQACVREKQE